MTFELLLALGFVWSVSERLLIRRSGPDAASKDRGSRLVIGAGELIGLSWGIAAAYHYPSGVLPARNLFRALGVCAVVVGIVLRMYSITYLGRFFTNSVAIAADHRLMDSGPYKHVRHPGYTGALMLFLGLGLSTGNWLSVVMIIVPIFAAFWYRMRVEEAALLEALGEPYRRYMERTKRLVPIVY